MLLATVASQGRLFPPSVLLVGLGYAGLALIVDAPMPLVLLAPIFLGMLITVGVFSIQVGGVRDSLGAFRIILPPILSIPFVFLAAWNMEQLPLNPQDTRIAANAAQLLGAGDPDTAGPRSSAQRATSAGGILASDCVGAGDSLLPDASLVRRLSGGDKLPSAARKFGIQFMAFICRTGHPGVGGRRRGRGKPSRPAVGLRHAARLGADTVALGRSR